MSAKYYRIKDVPVIQSIHTHLFQIIPVQNLRVEKILFEIAGIARFAHKFLSY